MASSPSSTTERFTAYAESFRISSVSLASAGLSSTSSTSIGFSGERVVMVLCLLYRTHDGFVVTVARVMEPPTYAECCTWTE